MHAGILIERVVRQTTVLIAQLSTAAGIRAPLSHIADQVFIELSREIEAQGVARKVVADMFGLALRTYQRKVQRLSESATQRNTTLWEAVLEHIRKNDGISRARLSARFANDDPEQVAAVITDLVSSGLIYSSGRWGHSIFRALTADERRAVAETNELEAITGLVWFETYRRQSASVAELATELGIESAIVERAIAALLGEQRVTLRAGSDEPRYEANAFLVPMGAEHGWEAAVCDHYCAVATAIGMKLDKGPRTTASEDIGGATYAFEIHDEHPARERVLALLRDERARVSALWEEVRAHNHAHPIEEHKKAQVTFYFGQSVIESDARPAREEQP
jgi:hypothetical protein